MKTYTQCYARIKEIEARAGLLADSRKKSAHHPIISAASKAREDVLNAEAKGIAWAMKEDQ